MQRSALPHELSTFGVWQIQIQNVVHPKRRETKTVDRISSRQRILTSLSFEGCNKPLSVRMRELVIACNLVIRLVWHAAKWAMQQLDESWRESMARTKQRRGSRSFVCLLIRRFLHAQRHCNAQCEQMKYAGIICGILGRKSHRSTASWLQPLSHRTFYWIKLTRI